MIAGRSVPLRQSSSTVRLATYDINKPRVLSLDTTPLLLILSTVTNQTYNSGDRAHLYSDKRRRGILVLDLTPLTSLLPSLVGSRDPESM